MFPNLWAGGSDEEFAVLYLQQKSARAAYESPSVPVPAPPTEKAAVSASGEAATTCKSIPGLPPGIYAGESTAHGKAAGGDCEIAKPAASAFAV